MLFQPLHFSFGHHDCVHITETQASLEAPRLLVFSSCLARLYISQVVIIDHTISPKAFLNLFTQSALHAR